MSCRTIATLAVSASFVVAMFVPAGAVARVLGPNINNHAQIHVGVGHEILQPRIRIQDPHLKVIECYYRRERGKLGGYVTRRICG